MRSSALLSPSFRRCRHPTHTQGHKKVWSRRKRKGRWRFTFIEHSYPGAGHRSLTPSPHRLTQHHGQTKKVSGRKSISPMRLADSRDRASVSAQTRPHHDGVRVVPVATHAAIYPTVCFSGRRTATDDRRFVDFLFGRVVNRCMEIGVNTHPELPLSPRSIPPDLLSSPRVSLNNPSPRTQAAFNRSFIWVVHLPSRSTSPSRKDGTKGNSSF